jgi:cobalt/nickel transport system permease protein
MSSMLFAVHIADGLLAWPWLLGGAALAAIGVVLACRKLDQAEIPRVGVLSAVFFVASTIHVPLGFVSVHLLLNGLVAAVLGKRAALAIAVGLFLQAILFGHGGLTTLGVNTCILWWPALLGALVLKLLARRVKPVVAGMACGFITSTLTVVLNAVVLWAGGVADLRNVAILSLLSHLPVIGLEMVLVGFVVQVFAKAKPDWLGLPAEYNGAGTSALVLPHGPGHC